MTSFGTIFRALNEAQVRYVAVGGVATVLHGHVRLTRDIDMVVDLEPGNVQRLLGVLGGLQLEPVVPVPAAAFADPAERTRWAREKHMLVYSCRDQRGETYVDVFIEYPMPWEPLWRDAEIMTIDGTPVRVASLEHLIALKRAADRPRDRDDVERLSEIQALGGKRPT